MGLLNSILSTVEGQHSSTQIIQIMSHLIEECGGTDGLLDKFKQNGFEELLNSWLGNGQQQPLSADVIQSVLGNDVLQKVATKVGLTNTQVSDLLVKYLPGIVGHLSQHDSEPWDLSQFGGDWLKNLLK